jgi:hypothetical protein
MPGNPYTQYLHALMVQQQTRGAETRPLHAHRVVPVETTCAATRRDVLEAVTPLISMHFPEGHGQEVCLFFKNAH